MKRLIFIYLCIDSNGEYKSSPTLLTSAAKDKNKMFSQISRCNCTTRMKLYVKTGPYAYLRNLSKQRFGVFRNSTHSLLESTYFSKLLFSARDPRSMPSCFFFFLPFPLCASSGPGSTHSDVIRVNKCATGLRFIKTI